MFSGLFFIKWNGRAEKQMSFLSNHNLHGLKIENGRIHVSIDTHIQVVVARDKTNNRFFKEGTRRTIRVKAV